MNKTKQKNILLKTNPNCSLCGCKMVVSGKPARNPFSHEAVLKYNQLICMGCHNRQSKLETIERLPLFSRWKKKFDNATGVITVYRRYRKRLNKFIYVHICGGQLTGKL